MRIALRLSPLLFILALLPQAIGQYPRISLPPHRTGQVDTGRLRYDLISGWRRSVARHQPGEPQ